MNLDALIDSYGYAAVLVGTMLEGETVLVLAGFAARRGYLALSWVVLAAFVGGICGDQAFFFLGRSRGRKFLSSRPHLRSKLKKIEALMLKRRNALVLGFRFMYGFRAVVPLVVGMSGYPFRRFLLLDALGAIVWAALVGTAGYFFGIALEALFGEIKRYEGILFAAIAATGLSAWAACLYFRYRQKRSFAV